MNQTQAFFSGNVHGNVTGKGNQISTLDFKKLNHGSIKPVESHCRFISAKYGPYERPNG